MTRMTIITTWVMMIGWFGVTSSSKDGCVGSENFQIVSGVAVATGNLLSQCDCCGESVVNVMSVNM